jgi:hypothetical protein
MNPAIQRMLDTAKAKRLIKIPGTIRKTRGIKNSANRQPTISTSTLKTPNKIKPNILGVRLLGNYINIFLYS